MCGSSFKWHRTPDLASPLLVPCSQMRVGSMSFYHRHETVSMVKVMLPVTIQHDRFGVGQWRFWEAYPWRVAHHRPPVHSQQPLPATVTLAKCYTYAVVLSPLLPLQCQGSVHYLPTHQKLTKLLTLNPALNGLIIVGSFNSQQIKQFTSAKIFNFQQDLMCGLTVPLFFEQCIWFVTVLRNWQ